MTRVAPLLLAAWCSACALNPPPAPAPALKPFDTMRDLKRAMSGVARARAEEHKQERARQRAWCREQAKSGDAIPNCDSMLMETITVSAASATTSITNNQHADLDEGGIVKRHGDMLIVLRRGRLFTFGIGGGQLDSLSVADAFGGPAATEDSNRTWYDELLVWQDTVIVVGFSYERGGTEIGLFDLGPGGTLEYRETFHLRSFDYYSRTNYSSRLMGDRLLLFTSFAVPDDADPAAWLPAMRRWSAASPGAFDLIAPPARVFHPVHKLGAYALVHSLTSCSFVPSFSCEATVIVGDSLTAFYASPAAAYAWTTAYTPAGRGRSVLYRIPIDGSPVSAIGVAGEPSDQFAFYEDNEHHINVVTQTETGSWLLRVPIGALTDGSVNAPNAYYRPLLHGSNLWLVSRFVGPYLVAGVYEASGDEHAASRVIATRWSGGPIFSLRLSHNAQRIEPMGDHAVVVGHDGRNLRMTAIQLRDEPSVGGTLSQQRASQSEDRSHAFLYRADDGTSGLFGLPVAAIDRGYVASLREPPARIMFVRNDNLALTMAGAIDAAADPGVDDDCRASCLDWYGNARPIFIGERIFALMGYELVEGRLAGGQIETVRRVDFMPRSPARH